MSAKLTTNEFIIKANKIHNNEFKYIEEYLGYEIKIGIICKLHGIFYQTPHNHLGKGCGCPICANEKRSISYRKDFNIFIIEANKIHNNKFNYTNDYINTHTKITIQCPYHGIFKQKAAHHLRGHGCPKCGVGANISKKETLWLNHLNVLNDYRQISIKINSKNIKTDAFNYKTNTVYEFYGDYWHGNPQKYKSHEINVIVNKTFGQLYTATMDREAIIKLAGYNLVSIWEYDWNLLKK